MESRTVAVILIFLVHLCHSQTLIFEKSSNRNLNNTKMENQTSNQGKSFFPSTSSPGLKNVITMSKRNGMHCRIVCGKCSKVLGQSWSLRCNHDCYSFGILFRVCVRVTSYRFGNSQG